MLLGLPVRRLKPKRVARANSTCSRHPFRADNDVATAVCDRSLLFASVWLSTGQNQEPSGTVAPLPKMVFDRSPQNCGCIGDRTNSLRAKDWIFLAPCGENCLIGVSRVVLPNPQPAKANHRK